MGRYYDDDESDGPVILLIGDIAPQPVASIAVALYDGCHIRRLERMNLLFMGHGGDLDSCFALIDAITQVKASGMDVHGQVLGYAMSADALALQACRPYRKMSRWGQLMLHGTTSSFVEVDDSDISAYQKRAKWQVDLCKELLLASKLSKKQVDKLFKTNVPIFFGAQEALELDLIDEVVEG